MTGCLETDPSERVPLSGKRIAGAGPVVWAYADAAKATARAAGEDEP